VKAFSILLLTLLLAASFGVAADRHQPPTAGNQAPAFNVDSHKSFCTKEGVNFKVLADSSHAVAQKYGSIVEYNGMILAARNTFLIDPTGAVRKVYLKVSPQGPRQEVLADLQQLQSAK
jgi:peroxiredoxin